MKQGACRHLQRRAHGRGERVVRWKPRRKPGEGGSEDTHRIQRGARRQSKARACLERAQNLGEATLGKDGGCTRGGASYNLLRRLGRQEKGCARQIRGRSFFAKKGTAGRQLLGGCAAQPASGASTRGTRRGGWAEPRARLPACQPAGSWRRLSSHHPLCTSCLRAARRLRPASWPDSRCSTSSRSANLRLWLL